MSLVNGNCHQKKDCLLTKLILWINGTVFELYIEHILEYLSSDIQGLFDHFPHFLLSCPRIQVPTRPHPASLLRLDEIGHIQSDIIIDLLS